MQAGYVACIVKKHLLLLFIILLMPALMGCASDAVEDAFNEEALAGDQEGPLTMLAHYIDQPSPDFSLYHVPTVVKGIYVSAPRAGSATHFDELVELCNNSAINAMVIDVRTEEGVVSFIGEIPIADEIGASHNLIPDVRQLIATLRENNIYAIARVVAFKDSLTVETRPDLYIKNADGSIWLDPQQTPWMNPYNKDSWAYIMQYAICAAELGFQEIQFDYIRFAASQRLLDADFGDTEGKSRTQVIEEFCQYAMETLAPYGVKVSADVYGAIISSEGDAAVVGQDYVAMARVLDIICPMVYPSHYANNTMGIAFPDTRPYEIISGAMALSGEKLSAIPDDEHCAIVRPWLQDFTASWLSDYIDYGPAEREAQMRAVYDAGLEEWLLWDAGVRYEAEGIITKD